MRAFASSLAERWRTSLTTRIMVSTGAITVVVIAVIYATVTALVGTNLFENRRDQVLEDALSATQAAQRLLDASDASDRAELTNLMVSVRAVVADSSSSSQVLVRRDTGQLLVDEAPVNFSTDASLASRITPELAEAVSSSSNQQYWQSVGLADSTGREHPGIVVGSTLIFPAGVGAYEVFFGYSLAEAEETLAFVQQALVATAIVILALMGVLVFSAVRFMVRPIRVAAETSRRIEQGENERMPDLGDKRFNQLAASFNAMADTVQHRIDDLAELSTMQQRFVSDVSHELRTPLTTIRLASDVIYGQRDRLDRSGARSAELLNDQVYRFSALLDDLLEITRYDAGSVELVREPCDLPALVATESQALQFLGTSEVDIDTSKWRGATVLLLDSRRIRRIVRNLVANALEFADGGEVRIVLSDAGNEVTMTVIDRGVGLTREQQRHVFERFWRADPARTQRFGGNGLGLPISLEDAQLHGGTIEVRSDRRNGTRFTLRLPKVAESG